MFQFVKNKVWKKLKGWKEKFFSPAGRGLAVVQAIPSYVMECFRLLNSVCNQIEALTVKFFWSGNVDEREIH